MSSFRLMVPAGGAVAFAANARPGLSFSVGSAVQVRTTRWLVPPSCHPHQPLAASMLPSIAGSYGKSGRAGFCRDAPGSAARGGPVRAASSDETDLEPMPTVVLGAEDSMQPGVVLLPDFRLALTVLAVGLQLWKALNWATLGIFLTFIGGFLTLQTVRLRFRFTSSALDVLRVKGLSDTGAGDDEQRSGADIGGTGGAIREKKRAIGPWAFSSVVNWEFWWPGFPVLAYFKEAQSKETGQRHFIPIIMDGKQLYAQMLQHFGESSTPKPAVDKWEELRPLHPYGYARCKQRLQTWWSETDATLELQAKLVFAKSMVQGMLDPSRRAATIEQIQAVWAEWLVWVQQALRAGSRAVKQMIEGAKSK